MLIDDFYLILFNLPTTILNQSRVDFILVGIRI